MTTAVGIPVAQAAPVPQMAPPTPVSRNKWFMIAVAVVLTVMFIVCMYYMFKSSSSGSSQDVVLPDLVPESNVKQVAATPCSMDTDCGTGNVCGPFMTCVTPPACWTGGNCKDGDYCRVSGNDCGTEGIYPMTCKKPIPGSASQYGECSR